MENELSKLARTAASQHGLLTVQQLRGAGIDAALTNRLVRSQALDVVRRGLYRCGDTPPFWEQAVLAACLVPGTLVAASHLTAANVWGMWTTDEIHVAVRYPAKLTHPGAQVHRSRDLTTDDVVYIDRVPVTRPSRTLVDLGLCLPENEVRRAVEHAVAIGRADRSELWRIRIAVGRQGRNGAGVMGRVLARLPKIASLAESGPEVRLLTLLTEAGLPQPALQYPVARHRAQLPSRHRLPRRQTGDRIRRRTVSLLRFGPGSRRRPTSDPGVCGMDRHADQEGRSRHPRRNHPQDSPPLDHSSSVL